MRAFPQALLGLVALAPLCQADSPSFSDQKPKWVDMEELFKNRRVLVELKLTNNQAVQGQLASLEPLAKHTAEVNKLQGLKPEEFQARLQKLMEIYNGRQREAVGKVLTRDQYKRIKQIQVQGAGLDAFFQPCLQTELSLTAEQKDRVRDVARKYREAAKDLEKPDAPKDSKKKLTKLRQETMDELVALLTEKQKKTWKEMNGAPFKLEEAK
jgi:hypothetical protein